MAETKRDDVDATLIRDLTEGAEELFAAIQVRAGLTQEQSDLMQNAARLMNLAAARA